MNRNNDVFSVLIGASEVALATKGSALGDLALGQIGVFSAESNLALDATSIPENCREFYLAAGVDTNGDGVVDNVKRTHIFQRNNVYAYTLRCYNPTQEWIFDLTDFTADCDEDYAVRFVFDSGALRQLSVNSIYKDYFVHTGCCDTCEECPSGDCVELAELIVDAVNNDEDNLFSATGIMPNTGTIEVTHAPDGAGGDVTFTLDGDDVVVTLLITDTIDQAGVKIAAAFDALDGWSATYDAATDIVTLVKDTNGGADSTLTFVDTDSTDLTVTIVEPTAVIIEGNDWDTFVADWGADVCPGVRFTSGTPSIRAFCDINSNYVKFREYSITPTFGDSFTCNGTWTTVQTMAHEEGSGYDIAWEEYESGGWEGNPHVYRQSGLHGLPLPITYHVDQTAKYIVVTVSGDVNSVAGFHKHYDNPFTVRVAMPYGEAGEQGSLYALVTVLDHILDGAFGPLIDDLGECPGDGTTVQYTSDIDDYDKDGIG